MNDKAVVRKDKGGKKEKKPMTSQIPQINARGFEFPLLVQASVT